MLRNDRCSILVWGGVAIRYVLPGYTVLGSQFSVAGPMAWNSLPDFIRDPTSSTDCFRRLLKTYLFARYYTVSQKSKTPLQTLGHNFTNYYPIFNHSEIRIAINDESEASIAKHLMNDKLLYYTFIIHSAGERIFKIGKHLAKLRAKSLTVSYTPFALHAFLSSKMLISPDKLNNLC